MDGRPLLKSGRVLRQMHRARLGAQVHNMDRDSLIEHLRVYAEDSGMFKEGVFLKLETYFLSIPAPDVDPRQQLIGLVRGSLIYPEDRIKEFQEQLDAAAAALGSTMPGAAPNPSESSKDESTETASPAPSAPPTGMQGGTSFVGDVILEQRKTPFLLRL